MQVKQLPIGIKLIFSTALLLVVALSVLTFIGISNMLKSSSVTEKATAEFMTQSINDRIQENANQSAVEIESYLLNALSVANTLALILTETNTHNGGVPLRREMVKQFNRQFLAVNPNISAIYSHFEANGYDGQDYLYLTAGNHSSPSGSLEIYYAREGDEIVHYPIEDPDEKYLDDVDEFGQRASEWYLCGYDTLKTCTLEPYFYGREDNNKVLMTTISVPVLASDQFMGQVGIDLNLSVIQEMLDEIANDLGREQVEIMLLSPSRKIIASTKHTSSLNRPLNEVDAELDDAFANNQDLNSWDDTNISVMSEVYISDSETTWLLVLRQNKAAALVEMTDLVSQIKNGVGSTFLSMLIAGVIILVSSILVIAAYMRSFVKPMNAMARQFNYLASSDGDLTNQLDIQNHKELILMGQGFNAFTSKLRTLLKGILSQSEHLSSESEDLVTTASATRHAVEQQKSETELVATAVDEMAGTSSEVARLAGDVSEGADQVFNFVKDTEKIFERAVVEVEKLAQGLEKSSEQIIQVSNRSDSINSILETIRGIAEQTNLLALNAAIEAARAGEQGRGFAVVADEVRNLAVRTQESTKEIDDLIQGLQEDVRGAVTDIETSRNKASNTVEETKTSLNNLNEITEKINGITSSATQVATAADQQSAVSSSVRDSISGIGQSSVQLSSHAQEIDQVSEKLKEVVSELNSQLATLKV